MAGLRVGDLVIVEDRPGKEPRPIGIVTDRDLVVHVLAHPDRAPATTKIADIMRTNLVTATEDTEVETVIERMRAHAVRRVPIVDGSGGLQGIISVDDVLGWLRDQLDTATKLVERQGHGPHLRVLALP